MKSRHSFARVKKGLCFLREEIAALSERIEKIENNLSSVHVQCIQIDSEVSKIKDVILNQQQQIEKNESNKS